MAENDGAGAGGRGAGVTEIDWSAERLFHRSRSAHMLCPSLNLVLVLGMVKLLLPERSRR